MREFAVTIFSALAIFVLVDFVFLEGVVWKHARAQLQSQQANLQLFKNSVQQWRVSFGRD